MNPIDQQDAAIDRAFLWLAIFSAIAIAFGTGNWVSLYSVSEIVPLSNFEGGKGFAINFGAFVATILAVIFGSLATFSLVLVFLLRKGAPTSFCRVSGYILLLPFWSVVLGILWVKIQ